ncbi:sensor histidine kinase [Paenibacillus abyssi]|uniref:Oxygen sensor histidine kinase NreB n=1 Tax=Paenibacillus abyssi TaxID=1340531 RepID=A0A917CTG4_9BACL|nr:sensor histidine kinase [Paenibacillus abyssi]GGF97133.1 sensor histidine kinase LiaS [Paenibacillus abyssi]
MMVRLLRSSKWELILLFIASTSVSLALCYWAPEWMGAHLNAGEKRLSTILTVIVISAGFGYWAAQRLYRRIDVLHFALKQAANGNLAVRIPEEGARSFTAAYREFNVMIASMEQRMKLLQSFGEEHVMREAASNEAAVLEERRRLARDLHDTVSQQLFAIHMAASSLPKLLELDRSRAEDVMGQLIHMSSLAQKQMRGFIAQLRPMELEGYSLEQALDKWFPDYCRQNALQGVMDWRISEKLSEAKEHQFFLIIQEAMANIVKHAAAKKATLTLAETERQLVLTLQDDGGGFRADQVKQGSYGLSTMRERAQRLGGEAEIISKPGGGTRVRVTIPKYMNKEQESDEHNADLENHDR